MYYVCVCVVNLFVIFLDVLMTTEVCFYCVCNQAVITQQLASLMMHDIQ